MTAVSDEHRQPSGIRHESSPAALRRASQRPSLTRGGGAMHRAQTYMFVVNQNNAQIDVVDRKTGKPVSSFGSIGTQPGQFDQAHGIAVDSTGNVYVAENRGRWVHKFKIVQ